MDAHPRRPSALLSALPAAILAAALLLSGCAQAKDPVPGELAAAEAPTADAVPENPASAPEPPVYSEPEDGHMQLIPDAAFTRGMNLITQKDHRNGDAFSVFAVHDFRGGDGNGLTPLWRLCQWDSGPDLSEMLVPSDPGEITDGQYRAFRWDPTSDVMTFRLDTSLYYGGKPAREGDWWPHLLIECPTFGRESLPADRAAFYRCDADSLTVSFDIRLTEYEASPVEGDWVDAAQFLLYFYVKGIDTEDFCWFGLQLFDSRWPRNEHYIGYDGGKADASGAMIYSVGSKYIYPGPGGSALWKNGAPSPDGVWHHVELNLVPYLKNMMKRGKADNCFTAQDLSGLSINGMNLGWETIGTFRHTMEMRNLRLTAARGE